MAKKFALIKTFANGNKGVSLVADKQRPKEAFLKACKGNDVVEVELFRMESVKRLRVKVQAEENQLKKLLKKQPKKHRQLLNNQPKKQLKQHRQLLNKKKHNQPMPTKAKVEKVVATNKDASRNSNIPSFDACETTNN